MAFQAKHTALFPEQVAEIERNAHVKAGIKAERLGTKSLKIGIRMKQSLPRQYAPSTTTTLKECSPGQCFATQSVTVTNCRGKGRWCYILENSNEKACCRREEK
jgi:hypothetical protein